MKRIVILLTGIFIGFTSLAQTDTSNTEKVDTVRVGKMIIIKKKGKDEDGDRTSRTVITYKRDRKPSKLSTNWFVFDIGFNNFSDKTNYAGPEIQDPATGFAPGATEDWFKLRNGKSTNVNIWIVMQKLSLINHYVNLKYGLGMELYNFRYENPIKFSTNPTKVAMDNSTSYSKNKLAADYVTVPLMLNFDFAPKRERKLGVSVGATAGYLYSSRQKTITDADGKRKKRDDFNLRPWKLAYMGEVTFGWFGVYGTMATQSMFDKGPDQTPYAVGLRFSW